MDVLSELKKLSTIKQKLFSEKLIPNTYPILGVKIPELRNLAKLIAKGDYALFIKNNPCNYFEEVLLEGFVIGYAKCELTQRLEYLKSFIPKIIDWAVCDCSTSTYKFVNSNLDAMWNFIVPYYNSKNEFEIRFALIMMLSYFVNEQYIYKVLNSISKFNSKHYYAQMGVAWLLSVCMVKFRDKTYNFLLKCDLDDFTFNKTISKCCESFRVSDTDKQLLKTLKKAH